jgi:hypothetical protein
MLDIFHAASPSFYPEYFNIRMVFQNVIRKMTASKSGYSRDEYFHIKSSRKSISDASQCRNLEPVNLANLSQFRTEYAGRGAGLPKSFVEIGSIAVSSNPVESNIFRAN